MTNGFARVVARSKNKYDVITSGNFRDAFAVVILYESRDGVACNKNRYDVITIGNFHGYHVIRTQNH
jgi:hypothetical protein